MKSQRIFLLCIALIFLAEIAGLLAFAARTPEASQDTVAVNEAVQELTADWDHLESHEKHGALDYVALDADGTVLYRTQEGLSESINAAVAHRDTILDIKKDGVLVGKAIIFHSEAGAAAKRTQTLLALLAAALLSQAVVCILYLLYLRHAILQPFQKLKGFAQRMAGGNLDVPLEMDRQNIFGAFTESFDLMRSELKKARQAEAEAEASKKELIAKLSHDIRTPVASIRAASEVGAALSNDSKITENYMQIIRKTDQINALVGNLFTAALEELRQLTVSPVSLPSTELQAMLTNSDYRNLAELSPVPECFIEADPLRLQQVFDNIFSNAYKYAGTKMRVDLRKTKSFLEIAVQDFGDGVPAKELPMLKEKFRRGSNAANKDGAGLGLYLSDYFMKEMGGDLLLENGTPGLRATVCVRLSGSLS